MITITIIKEAIRVLIYLTEEKQVMAVMVLISSKEELEYLKLHWSHIQLKPG